MNLLHRAFGRQGTTESGSAEPEMRPESLASQLGALGDRLAESPMLRWIGAGQVNASSPAFEPGDVLKQARASLRPHLGIIIAFSAAINLLYLAPSLYMLQVYDRVIPTGGVLTLVLLSVVLVVSLSILGLLDSMRTRLMARAALRVERLAANAVVDANMAARRVGAQPAATMRDIDAVRQGLTSPAAIGLLDIPWTPLFILICFVIHLWIGVLALLGAALIFGLAIINERATRSSLNALTSKTVRYYMAQDADLTSAETLHALGAARRMRDRRARSRADLLGSQTEAAFEGAGYSASTKALRMLLQSAALGLGAYLAVERQISPGAIIAATILTARAFAPVEQIVGGWRQIGMAFASYKSLQRLFSEMQPRSERTPLPAPEGRIQVENLTVLAPDGRTVALQGASFSASPGEIIGIIGPSGAGKSTLARALANAATPRMGAVRIDGARYSDWDEEALARHVGYLPQRIELFDGPVSENIARFSAPVDERGEQIGPKIVEAAQRAGAHDLILRLPKGYETELGPSGAGISPGQAQRIALARALYGDPRVLVLDEPNSHLDQDGESALIAALDGVRKRGGVAFVVAHRAGVLAIVDKIMLIKDGRIADFGPRAAMIAKLQPQRADAGAAPVEGVRP